MDKSLTFLRKELLYDASSAAWVQGHLMDEGAQHARHLTQDLAQDEGIDRATRMLNLAAAECTEALYPYTKQDATAEGLDDRLAAPEAYTITLSLPEGFSETTVRLISHQIHEYMVARVVADWLSQTDPEAAAVWMSKAEEARKVMRRALMSRQMAMRRKLKPF